MGLVLVDQDATIADFERALLDAFLARHPGAPFIDIADRSEVSARKQYGPRWGPAVDAIMGGPQRGELLALRRIPFFHPMGRLPSPRFGG